MSNKRQDADREKRLDRIAHKVYRAMEQKKSFDYRKVIKRYPELKTELESFFQDLGLIQAGVHPADALPAATRQTSEALKVGEQLGRYRIVRMLGRGGFGQVYLAQDDRLHRQVAIKVPTPERFQKPEDAEKYLVEAQMVASLDHPNIVPVYDTGQTSSGMIYVVSRFIEGCTLADKLKTEHPGFAESADLIATIAMALHDAHAQRLIHRDIKPSNILLEQSTGTAYLTDFGLAVREEEYAGDGNIAGSPAYMSPEQARGEGHRLDTRSDIFSLGIVFYELLTGERPFQGPTIEELLRQTTSIDPPAPKHLDASIPDQLERICLKSLSKRASQRYATAAEIAEDLRCWRISPPPLPLDHRLIPRPRVTRTRRVCSLSRTLAGPTGPVAPESLLFWKTRVEESDPEQTFPVGLLYGPSGCGKTSLVKAGLLPQLSDKIKVIYVESASDETEDRILYALRKQISTLPRDLGLADTCAALRRLGDSKVLIVLDQFEQWLNSHQVDQQSDLTAALRQCDGSALQAILMVRDDFGMAATRFMDCLDIPLSQGRNFATVDLFDREHAYKILVRYGQAFGKLPQEAPDQTKQAKAFLDSAIDGLSQNGKIVPVRLALFAEMVKGRSWTTATLRALGGMQGIGVSFLDSTFCSPFTNPKYRVYERPARSILKSLLPTGKANIKGHMRSVDELLHSCDDQIDATEFAELIQILDGDLRLITPTEQLQTVDAETPPSYQLTHDFLVPSLREWLTRRQQESWQGRAQLRLAERSALWNANRENRYLPSLSEWIQICVLTKKRTWTQPQRSMMKRASRVIAGRAAILLTVSTVLWVGGYRVREELLSWMQGKILQTERDQIAVGLVNSLARARIQQVPSIIREISQRRASVDPILKRELNEYDTDSSERLHISLALLPSEPEQLVFLKQRLLTCDPDELGTITDLLSNHQDQLLGDLWDVLDQRQVRSNRKFLNAAGALAKYDPTNMEKWEAAAPFVTERLVRENPWNRAIWLETFRPIGICLVPTLSEVFHDQKHSQPTPEIDLAANYLKHYAQGDLNTLSGLLLDATPSQFAVLLESLATHGDEAIDQMKRELAHPIDPQLNQDQLTRLARRRAAASIALLRMGLTRPTLNLFMVDEENPDPMTQLIHRCRPSGVSSGELLQCFDQAMDLRESEDDASRSKWNRVIYGLLIALGEFAPEQLPPADRGRVTKQLVRWYEKHPSAAVHGACGWLLRQWGFQEEVSRVDTTEIDFDASLEREWFVIEVKPTSPKQWTLLPSNLIPLRKNAKEIEPPKPKPIYFTMIVFPSGEFTRGSPGNELGHSRGEEMGRVVMTQSFAVSDCEVTWRQFSGYDGGRQQRSIALKTGQEIAEDQPAVGIDWHEAINYCRWLTTQTDLAESDQWHQRVKAGKKLTFPWLYNLEATGFRLLSEAEWEYACRCGTRSAYSFGNDATLLDRYGHFRGNDPRPVSARQSRPNLRGLFDMHGNVWEWCFDCGAGGDSWVNKFGSEVVRYPDEYYMDSDEYYRQHRNDYFRNRYLQHKIVRGGGTEDYAVDCRSSAYMNQKASSSSHVRGFRIGMSLP